MGKRLRKHRGPEEHRSRLSREKCTCGGGMTGQGKAETPHRPFSPNWLCDTRLTEKWRWRRKLGSFAACGWTVASTLSVAGAKSATVTMLVHLHIGLHLHVSGGCRSRADVFSMLTGALASDVSSVTGKLSVRVVARTQ
jgi:hypothetical protein